MIDHVNIIMPGCIKPNLRVSLLSVKNSSSYANVTKYSERHGKADGGPRATPVVSGEPVGLRGGHAKLQIHDGLENLAPSVNRLRLLTISDEFRARNTDQSRDPPSIFRLT